MPLNLQQRLSDSPFVERIWRSRSEGINSFISIAVAQLDLVVWKQYGKTCIALQGPETKAVAAPVPQDAEFFGILFKTGISLSPFAVENLVDGNVTFPEANSQSFWLNGSAWQLPNYENADTFVDWLARDGLLAHEPVVNDVLRGYQPNLSLRSVQRRFLGATGLSYRTIQQIERARHAAVLLQEGVSILDTVHETGYFDQPHLNHALKYFIGQTPTQLMDKSRMEQLSLLYKTDSFD